jgi:hypothetical protein
VIDTIHLVEVVQAIPFLARLGALTAAELTAVKAWFAEYTVWLTTSKNGMEERDTKNNHAMCWGMQVAAFAKFTGKRTQMDYVAERYKTVYIPNQMAPDGSFPLELARTKPYGYSLFNLWMRWLPSARSWTCGTGKCPTVAGRRARWRGCIRISRTSRNGRSLPT